MGVDSKQWIDMIDYIYKKDYSKDNFINLIRHLISEDKSRGNAKSFFDTFPEYSFIKKAL